MFKKVNNSFGNGANNVIIGFLILIPVIGTTRILDRVANFIMDQSEWFIPYISKAELSRHPSWYHALATVTMFVFFWLIGWTRKRKFFGKNLNQWLDIIGDKVPVVKFIYGLLNKLVESIKKWDQVKEVPKKNKIVVLPSTINSIMMQVGVITNESTINVYSYEFKKVMPHYCVNFAPAYAVAGGSTFLVPDVVITECDDHATFNMTQEEAYQFTITAGRVIPQRFLEDVA